METPFNTKLATAKETGDLLPVWEEFVNTSFLLPVQTREEGDEESDFQVLLRPGPDGGPALLIAETPELLLGEGQTQIGTLRMSGGKVVQTMDPGMTLMIAVANFDQIFVAPKEQVQWLRDSIQPRE